jgi:hypothetical protein
MARRRLIRRTVRLLAAGAAALCVSQPLGCGGDSEREDGAQEARRRDAGDRIEAPPREVETSRRPEAVATPESEGPIATAVATPDARRGEPEPRLTETVDPEDSERRVDEVWRLDAAGDDLDALLDTLARDPDPAVRVAAADLLAESERRPAIDGLLRALDDPSREVVLQVLETLSLVGGADIVPAIEPLLSDDDPEIREAAEDTLYFVEDGDFDSSDSGAALE